MKAIYAICTLAAVAMAARCIASNNKLIDCRSVVYPRITKWDTNENNVVHFTRPRLPAEPVVFLKDYDIRDYGAVEEKGTGPAPAPYVAPLTNET